MNLDLQELYCFNEFPQRARPASIPIVAFGGKHSSYLSVHRPKADVSPPPGGVHLPAAWRLDIGSGRIDRLSRQVDQNRSITIPGSDLKRLCTVHERHVLLHTWHGSGYGRDAEIVE